jgi:hypothetical protein
MRWTQESGAILARRTMFFADGEDVWFWRPKAGVKFAGCETVKTVAQGMPVMRLYLW